jgi:hypothetical protein
VTIIGVAGDHEFLNRITKYFDLHPALTLSGAFARSGARNSLCRKWEITFSFESAVVMKSNRNCHRTMAP